MNGWLFPFVFLAEQIGMGSCIQHYENKFLIVLFPNEKPVWLYVTFPLPFSVAMKLVGLIFRRQRAVLFK